MTTADYIVKYLENKGINAIFGYPGGMVTHFMAAAARSEKLKAYCNYHEQASAFAACGYAQAGDKPGVAFATSGPGATNFITGIAHAYFESVPVLFITGQVNTNEAKVTLKVRQKGFQETDIISMVKDITKYSAYITDANEIKTELDKAFFNMTDRRRGPVLLDIPINIFRTEIEGDLQGWKEPENANENEREYKDKIESILKNAKKPVLLAGNGINMSGLRKEFKELVCKWEIPVVTSMIAVDLLPSDNPYNFGFIGAYGHRHSNMIISQCDLIISMGSRLDFRQTGAKLSEFAKNAKLLRIDTDENELENKIKEDEISVKADLKMILKVLNDSENDFERYSNWLEKCNYYKKRLESIDNLQSNNIVMELSRLIPDNCTITTDVGQNQVWTAQSFINKDNQRILFSGGHGAMGFSLPAALGAYYATHKPVYVIVGDGGFQMNIQELQFVVRENIPLKIIVLNNNSLGMIRHFQEMYFDSVFDYTVENKGYTNPDFNKIAEAYGIASYKIETIEQAEQLKAELTDSKPAFFNVCMGNTTYVYPKLEFGKPIYDQEPAIDRALLQELLEY